MIDRDSLEQLLNCIGVRCDLEDAMTDDYRFAVRVQQSVRRCLGCTTVEADLFLGSVYGPRALTALKSPARPVRMNPADPDPRTDPALN